MTILILAENKEKAENLRQRLLLFDESLSIKLASEEFTTDKSRFIVRRGENFQVIHTTEIAYIFTESRLVFLVDKEGNKYIIEKTLSDLDNELPKKLFFRVNRKFIVNIEAIKSFKPSFKGKISLELVHLSKAEVSISQENSTDFKRWIEDS